jgi:hypothetical membrane protein
MIKFFNIIPGGFYGILSVLVSLLGDLIALFFFPEYSMIHYDISHLALGPAGAIFNIGLIFSGILAIPFNLYLGQIIKGKGINESLRTKTVIISTIASIALALIGVFPAHPDNIILLVMHGLMALIFFFGVTIVFIIYGYFFLRSSRFSKIHAYMSFFVASIIILYMIISYSILEWIAMFAIMISVGFLSIFTIFKGF